MELLIMVVNKEEYFEKILSILVELEVTGATILDSEGLGHFLAYEVPIFAGLQQWVGGEKAPSRTILAVIDNKELFPRLKKLLAEENIDFTQPKTGIVITVPVNEVIKSSEEKV
jgi:nitrogen regulatory protein P-II 1